jgi:hypothetical protein
MGCPCNNYAPPPFIPPPNGRQNIRCNGVCTQSRSVQRKTSDMHAGAHALLMHCVCKSTHSLRIQCTRFCMLLLYTAPPVVSANHPCVLSCIVACIRYVYRGSVCPCFVFVCCALHVHLRHWPRTAGGRIIATLAYTHLRASCAHLRCDTPFPPKLNVEDVGCGSASAVATVPKTPPTRTESIIATPSNSRPITLVPTLIFRGPGNLCLLTCCLALRAFVCISRCNEYSVHR